MDSILSPPDSATFERGPSITSCSFDSTTASSQSSPEVTIDATEATVITPDSNSSNADTGTSPESTSSGSVVPKLEDLDVETALHKLQDAKPIVSNNEIALPPAPRKRGRPRKHPIVEQKKASHARSKTGCGTCRKRKKKCDETRPICQNCEKNNVVCDGYETRRPWQSGKQKQLAKAATTIEVPLPLLMDGIEGDVDMMFFQHFTGQVGRVLSLTDHGNPFIDIIVPMAMRHTGLMHSLLYLSGSCLLAGGYNGKYEWAERQLHHSHRAVQLLRNDVEGTNLDQNSAVVPIGDSSIAQTLVLCLQTVCAGDVGGEYRLHLNALKRMLAAQRTAFPNEELRKFILEFLLYHDYSNAITCVTNPLDHRSVTLMEDFNLPNYMMQPEAGTLLGVMDGLFGFISRIRALRDRIRDVRKQGRRWWEEPLIASEAWAIDGALRGWNWRYSPDSPRFTAGLLYRQCTWIYLQRTVSPSLPSPILRTAVDEGLNYLRLLPWDSDDGATQSILLMPLFLLGCAAFLPEQRPEIAQAFERLQSWSSLGNIKYARQIVEQVWEMMDQGLEEQTWDWERIMEKRGWDFLVT
ncbi:hypothetical protein DOTSEDRAFT_54819 [Dothistroma septosporum NZE10]|uniref:Zn(2)-C6 fungal-type domain-containing protein n=1 Tax=Dothistroma septosporum (strain NZE10 / CBS 128990) TaxID=675120 RepID=N1PJ82_DOTSN|nr:hypothetical protein DOTSEDRAFT_54819 [Dothistroma septosporum NZE10]